MKKLWLVLAAIVSLGLVQTAVAGPREDAFLKELQAKLSEKGSPWIAGHTSVSHLSFEEKKKLLTMPLVSELPYYPERRRLSKTPKDKPPATMDWRNHDGHNWMTAVHQQLWGDCWAFNWIAAQEARMKIFRNEPNEMYNLSEQFVVSCNPYGFGNGGTNYIGNWVMQDGVPDEACFPYRGSGQACTQRCSDWQARVEQIGGRIIDWGDTPLSTTAVQNEVMNGPTALAVNWKEGKNEGIREDFFYYKGGVYEPVMGEWIKSGHALCLCGWNSSGNWLVKNSWGTGWGAGGTNNGYGYVSKELWNNVWMVPQSLYVVRLLMEDMVLGPGNWQPGGQTNITVTLNSTGIDAANVQGTISFTDPYVSIDVDHSTFGNIPSQTQGTNTSNPFKVTASASCPLGHVVSVNLNVTATGGYSNDLSFQIAVGFMPCEPLDSFSIEPVLTDTTDSCIVYGLAYDETSTLYMTDFYHKKIFKFSKDGSFLGSIPSPEDEYSATGIAYDKVNACLWVTNSKTKMIYKVKPSDGSIISAFQTPATQYPTGLAFDGVDLWVVDRDANTIYQVATSDGSILGSFVIPVTVNYGPRGLAYDPSAEAVHGEGTLLLYMTHFNGDPPTLDSCSIIEIKRDGTLIQEHRCLSPGGLRGNGRVVCVDPELGEYWVDAGQFGPVFKITGFHWTGTPGVEEKPIHPRMSDFTILPNPTRDETSISFRITGTEKVIINIYDVTGKIVSCLADDEFSAGRHQVRWHGNSPDGKDVPSGVYFCRIDTPRSKATKKVLLLR